MPSWPTLLAVVGGVVLLASLFLFDWYEVGEGKLAPLRIDATVLAQADTTVPAVPVAPETPGTPAVPVAPQAPGAAPRAVRDADLASAPDDVGAWTGQGGLGTLGNVVLLIAALWAIGTAAPLPARLGRALAGVTAALGAAALVVVALRIAFPVEEVDGYTFHAQLGFGVFAAAAAAALITLGGSLGARANV